jgi:excisionase family DNA binding protein
LAEVIAMTDELLNAKQVAALLGVHLNTVKRLVKHGEIPHYRLGIRGDLRFDPADIDAWLATKRKETTDAS